MGITSTSVSEPPRIRAGLLTVAPQRFEYRSQQACSIASSQDGEAPRCRVVRACRAPRSRCTPSARCSLGLAGSWSPRRAGGPRDPPKSSRLAWWRAEEREFSSGCLLLVRGWICSTASFVIVRGCKWCRIRGIWGCLMLWEPLPTVAPRGLFFHCLPPSFKSWFGFPLIHGSSAALAAIA